MLTGLLIYRTEPKDMNQKTQRARIPNKSGKKAQLTVTAYSRTTLNRRAEKIDDFIQYRSALQSREILQTRKGIYHTS